MKGRRNKPYTSKTLLNAWRQLLEQLNQFKVDPACDLDQGAMADVTDYLLDRIDDYRPAEGLGSAEKMSTGSARFATQENRGDNRPTTGER